MKNSAEVPYSATVSAQIIRADGTIEEVGLLAAEYSNPIKQFWWDQVGRRLSKRRINKINKKAR